MIDEVLKYAIENGIIDIHTLQMQIADMERKKYLDLHEYEIYQSCGKWFTYLPDIEKGRRLVKRTTQEKIEDVVVRYYRSLEEIPTIKVIFYKWLDEKMDNQEICKGTYDRYINDFKRFFDDTPISQKSIMDITEKDLDKHIKDTIKQLQLSGKAYGNMRTLITGIFRYAKKEGYSKISISTFFGDLSLSNKLFTKKNKSRESQVFTDTEIELISNYCLRNPTLKHLGIVLALQTGVRTAELAALKFDDFDVNTMQLHIQRQEISYKSEVQGKRTHEIVEYTKTESGDRYIILPDDSLPLIKRIYMLNPSSEYFFEENGKIVLAGAFNDTLYSVCDKIGIKRKSMHKIRKTYGTTLLDADVDDSVVQEQMGHSNIATTRQYYYFCNKKYEERKTQINQALSKKVCKKGMQKNLDIA